MPNGDKMSAVDSTDLFGVCGYVNCSRDSCVHLSVVVRCGVVWVRL